MEHVLRLFVGPVPALAALAGGAPDARIYELTAASDLLVLLLDDGLHEALHAAYGTGEWLESGPRLTTRDLAAGAAASRGAGLAYVEIEAGDGEGRQSAVVWIDGALAMHPVTMSVRERRARAPAFWPVNAALRALGVKALGGVDELSTFGLAGLRDASDLEAAGRSVGWRS